MTPMGKRKDPPRGGKGRGGEGPFRLDQSSHNFIRSVNIYIVYKKVLEVMTGREILRLINPHTPSSQDNSDLYFHNPFSRPNHLIFETLYNLSL